MLLIDGKGFAVPGVFGAKVRPDAVALSTPRPERDALTDSKCVARFHCFITFTDRQIPR